MVSLFYFMTTKEKIAPKLLNIKSWDVEDRPREKLLLKGKENLSNSELIAILIGSGNKELSAVDLSKHILQSSDNNLDELGRLDIKSLMEFKGIGEAKALSIIAALELGRRRQGQASSKQTKISSSRDAAIIFQAQLADLPHEEMWLLLLNRGNKVISKTKISQGGISGTVADIKLIMKTILDNRASAVILCHNHPSGNLKASQADIKLTRQINEACTIMDIQLLDHIIVAKTGYLSLSDEGILK